MIGAVPVRTTMSLDDHMASIVPFEGLNVVWLFTATLLIATTIVFLQYRVSFYRVTQAVLTLAFTWDLQRSDDEGKSQKLGIPNGTSKSSTESFKNGNGRLATDSIEDDIPPTLGEVSVSKILLHPIKVSSVAVDP